MNRGKICVSLIADSAEDLLSQARQAEPVADVIELRFDALDNEQRRLVFADLPKATQILLTMRPGPQGGTRELSLAERMDFWSEFALHNSIDHKRVWIDHEYDLVPQKDLMFWVDECFVIRSRHYLPGSTATPGVAFEKLATPREVLKIAVPAEDAADALEVWKLLDAARERDIRLIPIAMGEAGKWTRILGPAYGAFMTYASLTRDSATAPGQLTAEELRRDFRVDRLTENSAVFGSIAGSTAHSISPAMHNAALGTAGIDAVYVPFQVKDLDRFMRRMVIRESREVSINFRGFSVTNPHKQAIMAYLDHIDPLARRIGAVNTVSIDDEGKLTGSNTDAHGFISTLKVAAGDLNGLRAAVFGAGGAARACLASLLDAGAIPSVVARNEAAGRALADEFGVELADATDTRPLRERFDIVVNTTPLGTAGSLEQFSILNSEQLAGLRLVYDLVYNPDETRLMAEARAAGVDAVGGLPMLIVQGEEQFRTWIGTDPPQGTMEAGARRALAAMQDK